MYEVLLSDERYCKKIKSLHIFNPKGSLLNSDPIIEEAVPNLIGQQYYQFYKLIKLLCFLTLIYLVAGPWVGWDVPLLQRIFFFASSLIVFVWWFFKGYFVKLISCKKSKKLQICIYCLVPWRILSRYWGKLAAMQIPKAIRVYIFGTYCKLFKVNMDEIQHPLNHYPSLVAFFTRQLKENCRSIETSGCLIGPCDGTLVHSGPMCGKQVKHVKGLDYHLKTFLGYKPTLSSLKTGSEQSIGTRLFQCVFYLAPGDYHRFHSPCDWVITERTHFYGRLLSVSPKVTKWFPNLLALNERVVYTGEWEHGFFSYTAVGATNVGSISVHGDPTLITNERKMQGKDHVMFSSPYRLKRGEEIGYFSMGSSIVLIFEAPKDFQFLISNHSCIKLGNCLGDLRRQFENTSLYESYDCSSCNMSIMRSISDNLESSAPLGKCDTHSSVD